LKLIGLFQKYFIFLYNFLLFYLSLQYLIIFFSYILYYYINSLIILYRYELQSYFQEFKKFLFLLLFLNVLDIEALLTKDFIDI